jgi:hypothetical protein
MAGLAKARISHGPLASEERAVNSSATLLTTLNSVYSFTVCQYKPYHNIKRGLARNNRRTES